MSSRTLTTRNITKIAILSLVSFILMEFEILVPFTPPFYKLDVSEVVIMIGAFAMGPIAGIWMEAIKNLLNAMIFGTTTAYVGEFAAFIMGCSYVVPAAYIYQKHKDIKSAIVGMLCGSVSATIVSAITNYYIMIPAYIYFMGFTMEQIISMSNSMNPYVTIENLWGVVVLGTIPFNIVKWSIVSILVKVLYKHVSVILKKF
ncbi:MAG: ECF transporter S component [Erysipelotrichales bacterium]|nr:ECF transporter S component [Erysipelotrichales bacterium]